MIVSRERAAIKTAAEVGTLLKNLLEKEDELDQAKEHFWCVLLDTKHRIILIELVSLGILDGSLIHPREIFRRAIKEGASCLIIGHNHPSQVTDPSAEDREITRRLKEAGKLLGIPILDHVIIGETIFSFREQGEI
jgi:DNA repair protein RadC